MTKNAKVDSDADWIARTKGAIKLGRKCDTCSHEDGLKYLQKLLSEIIAVNAAVIPMPAIYDRVCATVPGYGEEVGFNSFRGHLAKHEPAWRQARMKK